MRPGTPSAPPPPQNGAGVLSDQLATSRLEAKRCSHALLFAQGGGCMALWPHVRHWCVNGHTQAQEWGWDGLSPGILRNWVKVYHILGHSCLGSEIGHTLPQGIPALGSGFQIWESWTSDTLSCP